MPDREKIVKAFVLCRVNERCSTNCPYWNDDASVKGCTKKLATDVYSLLKEQEPIPCGEKIKAGDVMLDFYECGDCKNAIRKPWRYCPFCGKEVKWDA